MKRTGEDFELMNVPSTKIVIGQGVSWSDDLACQIGFGGTAAPGFASPCTKLNFFKNGELRDSAFFNGMPVIEGALKIEMDLAVVGDCLYAEDLNLLREVVNLAFNHAFTPITSVEINRFKRQYGIFLMIGSWRGLYQVKPKAFKASLGL